MKFGLIGAGAIGAIRASALERSKSCSLTAVHDLDEARARSLAPSATFHPAVEALIESPDVEAVLISTPPQFHEALETGPHEFVHLAERVGQLLVAQQALENPDDALGRGVRAVRNQPRVWHGASSR